MLSMDYFSGGVPPGLLFRINLQTVREVAESSRKEGENLDPIAELCLIGLMAYFEAFIRNHFASLINICPHLLKLLKDKNRDSKVDAAELLTLGDNTRNKLGFLLCERFEFGRAKSINGLYQDLLTITPFSKEEKKIFDRLLSDRNLLVHHGGVYTTRYAEQRSIKQKIKGRIYYESFVFTKQMFFDASAFLEGIVKKTMKSTQEALIRFIKENGIEQDEENANAVKALRWY